MELTEKRIDELNEKLVAYPLSLLQDFLTLRIHCERTDIDIEELPGYVRHLAGDVARMEAQKSRVAQRVIDEKGPRCTVCEQPLILEDINNRRSRMVDNHSHSWWICSDPFCTSEPILSDKYPYEILSDMGVQVHRKPNKPESINQPESINRRKRAASQQRGRKPQ